MGNWGDPDNEKNIQKGEILNLEICLNIIK